MASAIITYSPAERSEYFTTHTPCRAQENRSPLRLRRLDDQQTRDNLSMHGILRHGHLDYLTCSLSFLVEHNHATDQFYIQFCLEHRPSTFLTPGPFSRCSAIAFFFCGINGHAMSKVHTLHGHGDSVVLLAAAKLMS